MTGGGGQSAGTRFGLAWGLLAVATATFAGLLALGRERQVDVVMVYLLGVVLVAMRAGYVASLVTAVASVAAFDFFFTTPYYSLAIADARNVVTCVIMLIVACVTTNLTMRVRAHAELAARARRAELEVENERLRNALLSSVSHDLRTPLAVVKGAATALLDDEAELSPERRREYLETISEEASRLNRLVRNLLDMTSLESGTLRVKKEWQPIEEVVGVALERVEERLLGRPVAVRIPPDLPLVALDGTLVEQVLINLLENAAKYTPPGTAIEINARPSGSAVELEIADSGPGVPPGEEERVFQKFHRATGGATSGMGLGLTICRGILTAHGGSIVCAARPEGGASFKLSFPQVQDAPGGAAAFIPG